MEQDADDGFYSIEQLLMEQFDGDDEASQGVSESPSFAEFSETQVDFLVSKVRPQLSLEKRRIIVENLLALQENEILPRGTQSKIARQIGCHRSTISRHYKRAREYRSRGEAIDVRSRKEGKCGRKPKQYSDEFLYSVPLHLRTTVRSFAGALKIPPSAVWNLLKKGRLRSHSSNNHPALTDSHKTQRIKWILSHIFPATPTQKPSFMPMENYVHIDEKWFVLNPDLRRFILLPWEEDPYRCAQSRNYKIKVMFIAATSRPLYDNDGSLLSDGKYGIWPFIERVAAKKSSKNRPRGTVETKPIEKVTQQVIREAIITKIIPAIMQKWPPHMPKNVIIQQDNARPHIHPNDPEFLEAANQQGFNMQIVYQPPKSPDLNVLDLAQFRAFQSLMYQTFPEDIDDLIVKVNEAFNAFEVRKMKFTWLQLQYVMLEILKVKGGNNYKNPHIGKERLERIGQLPYCVEVDQEIINEAVKYLNDRLISVGEDYDIIDEDLHNDMF